MADSLFDYKTFILLSVAILCFTNSSTGNPDSCSTYHILACFENYYSSTSKNISDIATIYDFCYYGLIKNETTKLDKLADCIDFGNETKAISNKERPRNVKIAFSNDENGDANDTSVTWDYDGNYEAFLIHEILQNRSNIFKVVNSNEYILRLPNLCSLCNISVAAFYNGTLTPFSDVGHCPAAYKAEIPIEPNITINPVIYRIKGHEFWNDVKIVFNFNRLWQKRLKDLSVTITYFEPVNGDIYTAFFGVTASDFSWISNMQNRIFSSGCPIIVHIDGFTEPKCEINFSVNKVLNLTFPNAHVNGSCKDHVHSKFKKKDQLAWINKINSTISLYSIDNKDLFKKIAEHFDVDLLSNQTVRRIFKIDHFENITMIERDTRSPIANQEKSKMILLAYIIPIVGLILIIILSSYCLMKKYLQRKTSMSKIQENVSKGKRNTYGDVMKLVDHWEIPVANLHIDEYAKLGSGEFGTVYKAQLTNLQDVPKCRNLLFNNPSGQMTVAVKTLPHSASILAKERFFEEIEMMKKIGYHDHLINLLGCITVAEPLCLVIEFCPRGDLHHYLRDKRDYMVEKQLSDCPADKNFVTLEMLLQFAWQIASGMEYLAEHNFVHRDLACRNVLLDQHLSAKIGDFGLCRYVQYHCDLYYRSNGGRLPIKWMAIESILDYKFTSSSDMWSYGVVLFELFSFASSPYPDVDPYTIGAHLKSGQRMEKPEGCPIEIYDLMQMTWQEEPSSRPTFAEMKQKIQKLIEELKNSDYNYVTLLNLDKSYYNLSQES